MVEFKPGACALSAPPKLGGSRDAPAGRERPLLFTPILSPPPPPAPAECPATVAADPASLFPLQVPPFKSLGTGRWLPPGWAHKYARSCFRDIETDAHSLSGTEARCAVLSLDRPPVYPPQPKLAGVPCGWLLVSTGQRGLSPP